MSKIDPIVPEETGNTIQSPPAKMYCFTFNNYTQKEYEELISSISSNSSNKYIIGKEIGEKYKTPHLQGFVNFSTKLRLSALKKLYSSKIHWEKCKGNQEQNYDYCSKGGDFVTNIVIKNKPIPVKTITNLLPFQKSLEDIVNGPINEGKVIWVYDPIGQTGKTQFVRYMHVKYNCPFAYGGKCSDIINLAFNNKKYLETTQKPCFIYNFGREVEADKISYNSMEQISDGLIANTKYEAGNLAFNQPHLIVLANCLPLMKKLTKSRWIIKTIDSEMNLVDYGVVKKVDKPDMPVEKIKLLKDMDDPADWF